jgi:uncharacterized protein (DUF1778 family)
MTTKRKTRVAQTRRPIKDDTIRMRVSAEQKQALLKAAEDAGLELSVWLRQLGLRAAGFLPEAK